MYKIWVIPSSALMFQVAIVCLFVFSKIEEEKESGQPSKRQRISFVVWVSLRLTGKVVWQVRVRPFLICGAPSVFNRTHRPTLHPRHS